MSQMNITRRYLSLQRLHPLFDLKLFHSKVPEGRLGIDIQTTYLSTVCEMLIKKETD